MYLKDGTYFFEQANEIGKGSFGRVFKGQDLINNRVIAIKQIQINQLRAIGEQMEAMICNEISIVSKIKSQMKNQPCPYLIEIYDCFRSDLNIYMIMEYCDQGDLSEYVKKYTLNQTQIKIILHSIALGLHYLHKMNITHRDIKLQNIFVSQQGFKIGDYGFAAQKETFDQVLGTVTYMAPEIIRKESYTNKVDVWSLGVIAYELLFKELYFKGKDKWETQENIKSKPLVFNPQQKQKISVEMISLLEVCLIKDQNNRPNIQDLLLSSLFQSQNSKRQNIYEECPFERIKYLLRQCNSLRQTVSLFQDYSKRKLRTTAFIQIYLLKKALCQINLLTYTIFHKANYIGLSEHQLQVLINQQNQQKYNKISEIIDQQCCLITQQFKKNFQQFIQFIENNFSHERELIFQVINDAPYDEPNAKVLKLQLQKWLREFKDNEPKLFNVCTRLIQNTYSQNV